MSKIWFITGSSRGFGRALVEAVLVAGDKVVATARKPEDLADLSESYGDQVRAVKLDVTSPAEVARAVAAALDAFGHIDVVVNNAGYGFFGAFEEMSTDEFKGQIDTNFWGVVHVTRAVVPILRRQGFGHIIQFRTDWAGASMGHALPLEAYAQSVGVMQAYLKQSAGRQPGDPRKGAAAILKIAQLAEPPLRVPLGTDAMAYLRDGYKTGAEELERWSEITQSTDFDGLVISNTEHPVLGILKR